MYDWVTRSDWTKQIKSRVKQTQPLSSSSSNSSLLKASAWGICSPGVYLISNSNPISAIAHLVILILADAVFGISSSGAKRYLRGLWSVCRVNLLPSKNCFNLVTTKAIASASRSILEQFF